MNYKPKILFISHESGIGGATVSLVNLMLGLKEENRVDIKVLIPNSKGKAKDLFEEKKIDYKIESYYRNCKRISEIYSIKYLIFDILNLFMIKKVCLYIKREKFDLICSNSTAVDIGARAAKLLKIPHIYYVREFMELDHGFEYRNKKIMKYLLENSEHVIFISKAIENYYISKYKLNNISCFYNGFIVQDYLVRKHELFQTKDMHLVQVGTFSDGKGTLNTLDLLYYLKQNGVNNWTMEFVGEGTKEYVKKLKDKILEYSMETQVTIGCFCMEMKKKLAKKDIVIMNSVSEGFGRVTVEGMLAGCLVIGRNLGGTKEIIDNGITGITFETSEDFFNVIKKIEYEKEKYRSIAKWGQEYAMKVFDYKNTSRYFMDVIEKCLMK